MTTEEQKDLIASVKAATHGMSRDEKQRAQELILMGICLALDVQGTCPVSWKALLMVGRAHKLFGR